MGFTFKKKEAERYNKGAKWMAHLNPVISIITFTNGLHIKKKKEAVIKCTYTHHLFSIPY